MLFDSGGKDFWLTAVLSVSGLGVRMCRNVTHPVPHTPLPIPQPQLSAVGTKTVAGGIEMLAHNSWNGLNLLFRCQRPHQREKTEPPWKMGKRTTIYCLKTGASFTRSGHIFRYKNEPFRLPLKDRKKINHTNLWEKYFKSWIMYGLVWPLSIWNYNSKHNIWQLALYLQFKHLNILRAAACIIDILNPQTFATQCDRILVYLGKDFVVTHQLLMEWHLWGIACKWHPSD